MAVNSQLENMKKTQQALRYQFISTELDLALTLVNMAESTRDEDRAQRYLDQARRAYQTAQRFFEQEPVPPDIMVEIENKMRRLDLLTKRGFRAPSDVALI